MIKLSILDQSPVSFGKSPEEAVHESVELARCADKWGYHRYWLAEHHNTAGLAGTSPDILAAHIAAQTRRLRVGSGGVLLPYYSPFKVAENFRMLQALYPDRIDLGIGRAPGGDRRAMMALKGETRQEIDYFPEKLQELIGFLGDSLPSDHHFAEVTAMPKVDGFPQVWMLGSSSEGASYAAHFGTAFSFAHFINGNGGEQVVDAYKKHFRPSSFMEKPQASVAIFVLCADTQEESNRLAASLDLRLLNFHKGERGPIRSPEEALSYSYTPWELEVVRENRKRMIFGDAEQVKSELISLASRYAVDELVIVTICHEFSARLRSYELLAEMFRLN